MLKACGSRAISYRRGVTLYWLLTNHQGSVTVVADASGAQVATRVYGPWGDIYDASGTLPTTLRYTGQREEVDIGLYDYKARWYDPWMGRFIQPDPIVPDPSNPQALNRYSYCLNDPVNHTDPSGYRPIESGDEGIDHGSSYTCSPQTGCTGNVPRITTGFSDGVRRLNFAADKMVAFYADLFGIPPDLLYTTLLVEYVDDQQLGQEAFQTFVLASAVTAKYGGKHSVTGWAGLGLAEIIEYVVNLREGRSPGVGYNNIHCPTVWEAQEYFASNYAGSAAANLVRPDRDLPGTVITLASTDGNTRYAAAILRQLADVKTGTTVPHAGDLTVDSQAVVYGAYRAGIGAWRSVRDYQNATPGEYGHRYKGLYIGSRGQ